jgi:hypothetical protein
MNEDRLLMIYTPPDYATGDNRLPVLVLLDGDNHFHHTTGIVSFLVDQGLIPQLLVVAVPNTDRTRDLTPTTHAADSANFPTAGGADRFLSFLGDELLPWIDQQYRTAPYRILMGHSFGGLFALEALETRPDLFQGYLMISPSTWWNEESLVKGAASFLKKHPGLDAQVYLTTGNEGGDMLLSAEQLASVFAANAPPAFHSTFLVMPDESHGSIPHKSTYDGLVWMYRDWRLPAGDLTALGLKGLDKHYADAGREYSLPTATPEATINRLGYAYLQAKNPAGALEAFQANVKRYPESANVYDSLGDGWIAAGEPAKARDAYAKAVEVAERTGHPVLPESRRKLQETLTRLAKP